MAVTSAKATRRIKAEDGKSSQKAVATKSKAGKPSRKLVFSSDPLDASGAYERLAAQLHSIRSTRSVSTLLVASALPDEGKSLTVANLALALSGPCGKRVLIVDADLRRPSLHALFGIPNDEGLSECLRAPSTPSQPVTVAPNLSLLPAGRPDRDPLEVLTSNALHALLAELARQFDWVLVDAPPLGAFPDAHLVASAADGVLLVVRAGQTPLGDVQATVKTLGRDRILGVVLNRAKAPAHQYYYATPAASATG